MFSNCFIEKFIELFSFIIPYMFHQKYILVWTFSFMSLNENLPKNMLGNTGFINNVYNISFLEVFWLVCANLIFWYSFMRLMFNLKVFDYIYFWFYHMYGSLKWIDLLSEKNIYFRKMLITFLDEFYDLNG